MSNPSYELRNSEEKCSNEIDTYILLPIKKSNTYLKQLPIYPKLKKTIENSSGGFFLYIKKSSKITIPVEICFFIENHSQKVVNVIILDENSKGEINISCLGKSFGKHKSLNYFLLKSNSSLHIYENHSWSPQNTIISKSYIILKENAHCEDYYINTKGYGNIVKKSRYLLNDYAKVYSKSELLIKEGHAKLSSIAYLKGKNTITDFYSRAITYNGIIHTNFLISAQGENSRGVAKCDGFIIDKGYITSIPSISVKNKTAKVMHEASVGSIPEDIINYFRMRGLNGEEAIDLFIRGFLK